MKRNSTAFLLCGLLMGAAVPCAQAHESPVERVGRALRIWTEGRQLRLRYEAEYSERSALLELDAMDVNGDGTVQESERRAYLADKANRLASHVRVSVGQDTLRPVPVGEVSLSRGWRQSIDLGVSLAEVPAGTNELRVTVQGLHIQPGEFQWTVGRGEKESAPPDSAAKATLRPGPVKTRGPDAVRKADCIELDFVLETTRGED